MLVLSRQKDETIIIGDNIEVTVVDIRGDKVRLGINAPRKISIHRKEVYDAIKRQKQATTHGKPEVVRDGGVEKPPRPLDASLPELVVQSETEEKTVSSLRAQLHLLIQSDDPADHERAIQVHHELLGLLKHKE